MSHRLAALLASVALLGLAAPASAQNAGADRRMERLEQSVRALQATVLQAQATGQPVVVRPDGPDPVFNALQDRVADLEQTLQRVNGQAETLSIELEQARRAETAAEAERRGALAALTDRLQRLEAQVAALSTALAPDPSAVDPAAQGTLGGQAAGTAAPPPPPPPPPPATAAGTFAAAKTLFDAGDHEGAGRAFEDFIARYPNNARALEAYYWLGESYFARRGYQTATAAFASALRPNPTATWAPTAMARLAQSLANANQPAQACAALAQFDQRYAARASAAAKGYAQAARTRARCG